MSKYDDIYGVNTNDDILTPEETVLLRLKPKKGAFVLNKMMTMLPIALLWLAIDSVFIISIIVNADQMGTGMLIGMGAFFLVHLTPVWVWLSNLLTAGKKWQNAEYIVTDRRIITKNGFIGMQYQTAFYKEISNVELRIQMVDSMCGVGDVIIQTTKGKLMFLDIPNPHQVYQRLQTIVMDIQSDIEFPNAMRPGENPGYNTKYTGRY